ncbi:MAG: hypothetical protein Q9187_002953 [Circinaria calcarea]
MPVMTLVCRGTRMQTSPSSGPTSPQVHPSQPVQLVSGLQDGNSPTSNDETLVAGSPYIGPTDSEDENARGNRKCEASITKQPRSILKRWGDKLRKAKCCKKENETKNQSRGAFSSPGSEKPLEKRQKVHPEVLTARLEKLKEIPPNQSIPQPLSPERTDSQAKAYAVQLEVDAIGIQESQPMLADEFGAPRDAARLAQPTEFKSTFKMLIHLPDGQFGTRIGKLDTGLRVDIISQQVMDTLGIKMEPYEGPELTPIGPNIKPLGSIKLDWHIAQRQKTYTTTFAVLDTSSSKAFDILLSENTIKEIGFYINDDSVWFLKRAD